VNIGIIVYSKTGNTLSAAQKLQEKIVVDGHVVNIEQITVAGEVSPGKKDFQFTAMPDPNSYEAIVFGTPVHAFSLCSVMEDYLKQLTSLEGKKVAFLVTKQLPFNWTGGNRTVGQMKKLCEDKGAETLGAGIVICSESRRETTEKKALESLSKLF